MKAILQTGFLALAIMTLAVPANAEGGLANLIKRWQPFAEQGDSDAQSNLGVMYGNGDGVRGPS